MWYKVEGRAGDSWKSNANNNERNERDGREREVWSLCIALLRIIACMLAEADRGRERRGGEESERRAAVTPLWFHSTSCLPPQCLCVLSPGQLPIHKYQRGSRERERQRKREHRKEKIRTDQSKSSGYIRSLLTDCFELSLDVLVCSWTLWPSTGSVSSELVQHGWGVEKLWPQMSQDWIRVGWGKKKKEARNGRKMHDGANSGWRWWWWWWWEQKKELTGWLRRPPISWQVAGSLATTPILLQIQAIYLFIRISQCTRLFYWRERKNVKNSLWSACSLNLCKGKALRCVLLFDSKNHILLV